MAKSRLSRITIVAAIGLCVVWFSCSQATHENTTHLDSVLKDLENQASELEARLSELQVAELQAGELNAVSTALTANGRLSLSSTNPIPTSDLNEQSTLYYLPYDGDKISLYNGSMWKLYAFSSVSLALSGLTFGKNYDVFLYDNSGTLALVLSSAWTSDTARAESLTQQDGVYVKGGNTTRRYLGTIRATGAGSTTDSVSKRFVWNYYNRRRRNLKVTEGPGSWFYNSTGWRVANSNNANRVEYVVGVNEVLVSVSVHSVVENASVSLAASGVGIDSTSTNSANIFGSQPYMAPGVKFIVPAEYRGYPGLGYHAVYWLEGIVYDATNVNFYGLNAPGTMQTGLIAEISG